MKKRILFVDDEENLLKTFKRTLHSVNDWGIMTATSVDIAIDIVNNNDVDLIITDYNMPQKTGLDLIKYITKHNSSIPVIMLTGNSEEDLKNRALECGAIDLLNKPTSKSELVSRITNILKIKEYEKQLEQDNKHLEEKVSERTRELRLLREDLIWRFAKISEIRDKETGNHIFRVANICKFLANKCNLLAYEINDIYLGSTLHDIGKVGIPDKILLKPGKLDKEEFEVIMTHTIIGHEILTDVTFYQAEDVDFIINNRVNKIAASIALTHHEKWDGSGYPNGLKGEEIPVEGRITAIVDVYDALRSDRPYKEAFSLDKTIEILAEGKGSHFDPNLLEIFLNNIEYIEQIREIC